MSRDVTGYCAFHAFAGTEAERETCEDCHAMQKMGERMFQPPATPQERVDVVAREIAKELMSNGFGDQGDRLAIRLGSQDFGGWSLDGAARQIRITLEQEGYVLDRMAEATRRAQLLASAPPAVWRDIETAPKDGTEVLLLWFDSGTGATPMRRVGFWHSREQAWCDTHRVLHNQHSHPTHWMPLPSPPTPEGTQP